MGRVVGRDLAAVGSELGKGRVPSGCVWSHWLGPATLPLQDRWLNPHQRLLGEG